MTEAEKLLKKTIEEYNSPVNNIAKFHFNKHETELFVSMMKQFAKDSIKADRAELIKKIEDAKNILDARIGDLSSDEIIELIKQ